MEKYLKEFREEWQPIAAEYLDRVLNYKHNNSIIHSDLIDAMQIKVLKRLFDETYKKFGKLNIMIFKTPSSQLNSQYISVSDYRMLFEQFDNELIISKIVSNILEKANDNSLICVYDLLSNIDMYNNKYQISSRFYVFDEQNRLENTKSERSCYSLVTDSYIKFEGLPSSPPNGYKYATIKCDTSGNLYTHLDDEFTLPNNDYNKNDYQENTNKKLIILAHYIDIQGKTSDASKSKILSIMNSFPKVKESNYEVLNYIVPIRDGSPSRIERIL